MFELATRRVTSFCVTRFGNSRIPNLTGDTSHIIQAIIAYQHSAPTKGLLGYVG